MMDPNKRGRKLFKGGKSKGYISIRAPDEGKKPYNVHISHFFFSGTLRYRGQTLWLYHICMKF